MSVIKDAVSGVPITTSMRTHASSQGKKILGDALGSVGKTVLEGKIPAMRHNPRKRSDQRDAKSKCKKVKRINRTTSVFR